jgi:hypothetical protein
MILPGMAALIMLPGMPRAQIPSRGQQQMLKVMNQMGRIMQQMQGPQGSQMQARHQQQLQEMQQHLDAMKGQLQHKH